MTPVTILELLALGVLLAILGGAVTGVNIAGEFLGKQLAAMMGAFYGPVAVLPAIAIGIALFAWLR